MGKLIFNSKDPYDNLDRSGVYSLKCDFPGCNCFYIGQTGRKFKTRMYEHFKCFLNHDNSSVFAKHLLDHIHTSNFNPNILYFCDKGAKLDFLENFEIVSAFNNSSQRVLNDFIPEKLSPLFTVPFPSSFNS
jgi:hypothetical protein